MSKDRPREIGASVVCTTELVGMIAISRDRTQPQPSKLYVPDSADHLRAGFLPPTRNRHGSIAPARAVGRNGATGHVRDVLPDGVRLPAAWPFGNPRPENSLRVVRKGDQIEMRTIESKPSIFRGERHADRISGEVLDEGRSHQFWMEFEPPLPDATRPGGSVGSGFFLTSPASCPNSNAASRPPLARSFAK